ncbi:hydrogenase accessory protein [Rubellimicrobium arenae]|uniref:hydrogenase accessory protein n=1 Tax=Rubellimicrobium arenae TaxID=2817372 RepID=UPI001B3132BD|nr:hydrogenase accessory protein [Rubellimicrobium arenae]
MTHPLIARLTGQLGWPSLDSAEATTAYAGAPGCHAVFVPGDPTRNLETADVAVILPELHKAFAGRFDCAVVSEDAETGFREATQVYKTPSIIFFRDGRQIGAIPKMRDWADYLARTAQILAEPALAH